MNRICNIIFTIFIMILAFIIFGLAIISFIHSRLALGYMFVIVASLLLLTASQKTMDESEGDEIAEDSFDIYIQTEE